jgi:hypothetical protein
MPIEPAGSEVDLFAAVWRVHPAVVSRPEDWPFWGGGLLVIGLICSQGLASRTTFG